MATLCKQIALNTGATTVWAALRDFGAVHSTVGSANAGLDLETPTNKFFNSTALKAALNDGSVKIATLDEKLVRRYTKMIEFGLFENPPSTSPIPASSRATEERSAHDMYASSLLAPTRSQWPK